MEFIPIKLPRSHKKVLKMLKDHERFMFEAMGFIPANTPQCDHACHSGVKYWFHPSGNCCKKPNIKYGNSNK